MIETNPETKESHAFCDRCQKELTGDVYVFTTGDILCKDCFDAFYSIKPVEEVIKENT